MTVQHGQQHGQTVALQTHAQAPRAGPSGVYQGLDFDQQGAGAFQRHQHTRSRHGLAVGGQEDGTRVAHPFEPLVGHGEHADLVDCAEAVLDGAHQAKAAVRVAFKVEHRVHDVLQHTRPGDGAFFRHMPHQHGGAASGLGHARQVGGAFPHLCHRTGGRGELVGVNGLNRIDHAEGRLFGVHGGDDVL